MKGRLQGPPDLIDVRRIERHAADGREHVERWWVRQAVQAVERREIAFDRGTAERVDDDDRLTVPREVCVQERRYAIGENSSERTSLISGLTARAVELSR